MRRLLASAAVVVGACYFWVPVVHATAITPSTDLIVNWSQLESNGTTLAASAELSNFTFGTNSVSFKMVVDNTTLGTHDVRFTSFGWDTAPASTASSDNNNAVYATTTNVGLSGVTLSVCFFSGNNCNGGQFGGLEDPANAGLHNDPTGTTADVTIDFASAVPPLDFSGFRGKFQTDFGSFEFAGDACTVNCSPPPPPPPPPPAVPEPATLGLLGFGALGTAALARRRRG